MTFPSVHKSVLYDKEATYGTATTFTKDLGLVQDVAENLSREVYESLGLGSIETQNVVTGQVDNGGSVTMEVQHGRPFELILGTVAHTNSSSDCKHTFTIQDSPPSATIGCGDHFTATQETALEHSGCLVENAELSIALNEVLKLKMDWKSKTCTSTTEASAAVVNASHPTFGSNQTSIIINSATASECQDFNIKMEKKVEKSGGIGHNLPQQAHATELRFSFSGKLGFQNKTYQELWMGQTTISDTGDPTAFPVQILADNGTAYGSGQKQVSLTLTGCHFTTFDKTATVGDLTFVDVAGKGKFKECIVVDLLSTTVF